MPEVTSFLQNLLFMLGPKQDTAIMKMVSPNMMSTFDCSLTNPEKNVARALDRLSLTTIIRQKEVKDEFTLQYFQVALELLTHLECRF